MIIELVLKSQVTSSIMKENTVIINYNETCSSHMPILLEFISWFRPCNVLEYSSGLFSTKALIDNCINVTSIEMESEEWYGLIKSIYNAPNWKYFYIPEVKSITEYVGLSTYDLIFVDDGESRAPLTNFSFGKSKVIIAHDTQLAWRNDFIVPANYKRIEFVRFPVKYDHHEPGAVDDRLYTTMFTSDERVYRHFNLVREQFLYEKWKFPYGICKPEAVTSFSEEPKRSENS